MKKLTSELAAEIAARFAGEEFRGAIEATEKASDADAGTFEVIITTEALDRYNEVIKLDGWQLDNYLKNAVVLWGHNHSLLPIGKATSIEVRDGKMIAKGKFALHEFAQEVRRLYDQGIICATSVGFIEKEREGNLITKAELIEFSFVNVPANPQALTLALKHGHSIDQLMTKGLFTVPEDQEKRADEETDTEVTADAETVVEIAAPTDTPEQRSFAQMQIAPVIESMKAALSALEMLATSEESEGTKDETGETTEQKQLRQFKEEQGRKALQLVATTVGDALAEARRVAEART